MQAQAYSPATISAGTSDAPPAAGEPELQLTSESRIGTLNSLRSRPASPAVRLERAHRLKLVLLAGRIVADGALLALAFTLAYWLRYGLELGRDVSAPESSLTLSAYGPYIAAFIGVTLVAFRNRGLYALPRGASWLAHIGLITSASLIGVAVLTLGGLMVSGVLPSRLIFIYLWICTILVFGAERLLYRRIRIWFWRKGTNIRRALVVGTGIAAQRIMKDLIERPDLGYKLVGYLADSHESHDRTGWRVPISKRLGSGLHRLGDDTEIAQVIEQHYLHEVIVALPAGDHARTSSIMECCKEHGIDLKLVPDLFEMRFNEVRIDALNGVPLIGVKDVALRGFNLVLKRVLDVVLAVLVLAIMTLPMLVIAAAVRLTSPGPVFFRQQRVGKGGLTFTCYKFRSMYQDAEARLEEIRHLNEVDGPIFKMKNDPRLTRVGKLLRSTSLDELPQIFNILKGEMSWVGPRPPTPSEVALYSSWHHKRLDTTSGLTGLWQVSGRSDLSFDEMVKLDLYYAENWSLTVDMMIILRTIPAVLKRSGAY